ncbi:MAG TPA: DnaB-like helicase N-terminal domain-containing protein [Phycisphaerae bacterium]|nr:DnaB-like helicase N-terminal domain-containing protein [Phycisphaerae bacterium]
MLEEATTRIPPHDIPAEASVLGAMMVFAPAVPVAREIVAEEDFYRPAHQIIFKALSYMADHPAKFGPPDLVTLRAALQTRGRLDAVGGVEYLVALADGVPSATNVEYYAQVVKDKARLRELIVAGTQAVNDAFGAGEASDILTNAAQAVAAAGNHSRKRSPDAAAGVAANIEAAIAGERESVAWPWRAITHYAKPCAPGAVTVICGDPGSGKSFLFQEAMLYWHGRGIKTAMLHLEKTRDYHQTRALAQLEGNSQIISIDWQKAHPDKAREIYARNKDALESYGATVWDDPDGATTLGKVQAWIAARINDSARIIGVDPITAAASGDKSWDADRCFVVACESMAARSGASIVLITHPRGAAGGKPGIDSLAGGRAYGRLTDCVMWVQNHNPPEEDVVETGVGRTQYTYNRTVTLCKTRDGIGQGMAIVLDFNMETTRTLQLGHLLKKKRKRKEHDDE